jgi:osomolarity two-component system sensor histidine kinase SLN1
MFSCDFYRAPHSSCGTKDFYATFYYTSALQTVALFGLQMKRISALIGATAFFILSSILILPLMSSWTRNSINFMFYQGFLIYMHYQREKAARRMYTLRDELENQFNATQNAQINERNAAESKRRLTSYVFHDEYPDC